MIIPLLKFIGWLGVGDVIAIVVFLLWLGYRYYKKKKAAKEETPSQQM